MKKYVDYNQSRGHPGDCDLFYECVLCGGLVSSWRVLEIENCPCGNLHKELGRLGTEMGDKGMRLVRITDTAPTEFQTETHFMHRSMLQAIDETSITAAERELMEAADVGDLSRVRALVGANSDVNANAANGLTALMIAAQQGHLDVVRASLAANADADAKSLSGKIRRDCRVFGA